MKRFVFSWWWGLCMLLPFAAKAGTGFTPDQFAGGFDYKNLTLPSGKVVGLEAIQANYTYSFEFSRRAIFYANHKILGVPADDAEPSGWAHQFALNTKYDLHRGFWLGIGVQMLRLAEDFTGEPEELWGPVATLSFPVDQENPKGPRLVVGYERGWGGSDGVEEDGFVFEIQQGLGDS